MKIETLNLLLKLMEKYLITVENVLLILLAKDFKSKKFPKKINK
jgi:hypothetical protein